MDQRIAAEGLAPGAPRQQDTSGASLACLLPPNVDGYSVVACIDWLAVIRRGLGTVRLLCSVLDAQATARLPLEALGWPASKRTHRHD